MSRDIHGLRKIFGNILFYSFLRLNEGHTVFVERKIAGRMFGEKFRHHLAQGGWNDLQKHVMP